jgi:uncharacterized protein YeaO (DUF488 family)
VKLYTSYWNKPGLNKPTGSGERHPLSGALKVSISRQPAYFGVSCVNLGVEPFAPSQDLLDEYKASEKTPEDIARFKRIYREGLDAVGIQEVKKRLLEATRGAKVVILLCHEKVPEKFCHRREFAAWYEEQTGVVIEEL